MAEFEREADRALESMEKHIPVSETKLLDSRVPDILLKNAEKHGEVKYSSPEHQYSVTFGFAEVKMDDGNLGLYNDIPEDLEAKDAETLAFMVIGMDRGQETEVQFYEGRISLNADRPHGMIVDFQRAVLLKGVF